MENFTGQTVLITGSARGIGRATALQFAKLGANVAISYLTSEQLAIDLLRELTQLGSNAMCIKCDVTEENQVKGMIDEVVKKYGKIDVLINNAGFAKFTPILEKEVSDWKKTMDINLLGPFLCIKHTSKYMLSIKSGKIINISSTSGIHNFDHNIADYDAAKAGLITLTKNCAKALAPHIYVNSVAPGWVDTEMNADLLPDFIENETNQIYLRRFGTPEDIAKAIIFLSGENSNYINGSILVVDGGHD